jgi:hypothetical protein
VTLNELRIHTEERQHRAETHVFVDGVELVETQRPAVRANGTPVPGNRRLRFLPADPVGLLPPDSRVLLPSAEPSSAMVGICNCGESGCGSLYLRVRRDGGEVLWEPEPNPPHHTVDRSWRFDLRQYLDAVDAGAATMTWAPRPLLLARELRRRQHGHWGSEFGCEVLDVRAWPGVDEIKVQIAGHDGVRWHTVPVPPQESDQQIINRLKALA